MAKSQETWNKKEKEKIRQKKKEEKDKRKEERKANGGTASFDDMIAYVDENGNLSSTPPDPLKKRKIVAADIEIGVPTRAAEEEVDPNRFGTVTFFDTSKGYGFIKDRDSQDSIFSHINGHLEQIQEADKVTFRTEKGMKGLNAVDVKIAKKEVVAPAPALEATETPEAPEKQEVAAETAE
jgi:cold shock CspA family protein